MILFIIKLQALLGLFYLCFFGVLFSLFALQMWITLHYISGLDKPYMQHSSQVARAVYSTGARSFFRATFAGFSNPGKFIATFFKLIYFNLFPSDTRMNLKVWDLVPTS